eukprot:TRINITY_DN12889_c0_g1_i1.p2 TRINITY_DN12889_c0_g1~~TRINITY_DN12889_c0_g1_i1.p2  ORF type:complete len:257 (-),score=-2.84 TRINITY_DN12889_c0_g1_i1:153-923(-)
MIDQALHADDVQGLHHVPRHIQGLTLKPVNRGIDTATVHGGEGSVTGVHCLEEGLRFRPTNFPDKDILGPLPHGGFQQVEHVDGIAAFRQGFAGHRCNPVVVVERNLPGIFDADHFCNRRNEQGDRIQGRGLARCRPPDKEETLVILNSKPEVDHLVGIEGPVFHQFDRRERLFPEFPDGERCSPCRHFGPKGQLQTGAIRQGGIDHRSTGGDMLSRPLCKGDCQGVEDIGIKRDVGLDIPVPPVVQEEGDPCTLR